MHGDESAGDGAGDGTAQAAGHAPREFFAREVARLMDRLYGAALRLSGNPHDAEDIVAGAVERAWTRLGQLRDERQFEGWLFRILNHCFIDHWRRSRSRQAIEVPLETEGDAADFSLFRQLHQPFLLWWGTPEDELLDRMLQDDVARALDGLPDVFRVVLVLVEIQGYRYSEVADLLDVPVGTVRSRLSRGRALLQRALWEHAPEVGLRGAGKEAEDG